MIIGMFVLLIGMMISMLSMNVIVVMMMNGSYVCVMKNRMLKLSIVIVSIRLIRCWLVYMIGVFWNSWNLYLFDSLLNVIIELENVIVLMNVLMNSLMWLLYGMKFDDIVFCGMSLNVFGFDIIVYVMYMVVRLISECIVVMSFGILVILMCVVMNVLMFLLMISVLSMSVRLSGRFVLSYVVCLMISVIVVRIVMVILIILNRLLCCVFFGFDRFFSVWMKYIDVMRYSSVMMFMFIVCFFCCF